MNPFVSLSIPQIFSEVRSRRKQRHQFEAFGLAPAIPQSEEPPLQQPRYPLPDGASLLHKINAASLRAQDYIFSIQHQDGYWWEVLDTNTTLTSEFIMLAHFMGMVDEDQIRASADYLLKMQQADGGWTLFYNGPSDLSTSVEAYFALKLCGHSAAAPHMKKARELILSKGGVLNARVFTKINLALFGQFPWSGVPVMPPQLILLPKGFTFNIYEFSSWARVVIVPLSIVMHHKPVIPIPQEAWCDELYVEPVGKRDFRFKAIKGGLSIETLFLHIDKVMQVVDKLPFKPFLETSLRRAEKWVLDHQDPSGDWGGILPAMINSLMALKCLGYRNDHPVIQKGWQAICRFQDKEPDGALHQQSCVSPVWDTAWYAIALGRSGVRGDHPQIQQACRWLLDRQILIEGDWKIKNKKGEPGGWAFEFDNCFYPDVDDTMAVLTALMVGKLPEHDRVHTAFGKGFRWLLSMQNSDGGWGAFDHECNRKVLNEIPFADLKSLLDPSTADLTGRVLEFLGLLGYNRNSRVVRKAIRFIKANQHECGGWWGRWGVNYLYGTWCVLVGLHSIGEDMNQEYIQRAVRWLKSIQNPDGGWGESCLSYEDENWIGKGVSTPSQTSWALMALMAAGESRSLSIRRGIEFLLKHQGEDGCWIENEYTGTGFPKHFYLGYRGYKNYFSLMALQQYKSLAG